MTVIRIRFTKLEPVRYISHLDLMRTFERAARRARVPLSYSEGFHPRPKFSFASALPVGVTSDAEYADFELAQEWAPERFAAEVNRQLPAGIEVSSAVKAADDGAKLMAVIDRATYRCSVLEPSSRFESEVEGECSGQMLQSAVGALLASSELTVIRERKGKRRELDIRPMIYGIRVSGLELDIDVASGSRGNVRPEEVLGLLPVDLHWKIHRTGLYVTVNGEPESPMEGIPRGVECEGS